ASDLFSLLGRWLPALMIALNNGSAHVAPVSRRKPVTRTADKAD
ncbi:CrfX protein, partial [Pseudomonas fluorescens]